MSNLNFLLGDVTTNLFDSIESETSSKFESNRNLHIEGEYKPPFSTEIGKSDK